MNEQPADEQERINRLETVLESDSPPLEPLGTTTDYRQLLIAWAGRHGLTLDEALERLAADPDPVGRQWVARIRADEPTRNAMEAALADRKASSGAEAGPEAAESD